MIIHEVNIALSQKNLLLIIVLVSIFVGGYFFYLSEHSYARYQLLNKKISYLTQELQNVRIEKTKLEFQLGAINDNKELDINLLQSRDYIAKNELLVDIKPPDLEMDDDMNFGHYIAYMLLMMVLMGYFVVYYFDFPLLLKVRYFIDEKIVLRTREYLSRFSLFRRLVSQNAGGSVEMYGVERNSESQVQSNEKGSGKDDKKKLFSLRMMK